MPEPTTKIRIQGSGYDREAALQAALSGEQPRYMSPLDLWNRCCYLSKNGPKGLLTTEADQGFFRIARENGLQESQPTAMFTVALGTALYTVMLTNYYRGVTPNWREFCYVDRTEQLGVDESRLLAGFTPDLQLVNEQQPIPELPVADVRNLTVKALTYGKAHAFTDQVLFNNNWGAITSPFADFGAAAQRTVANRINAHVAANGNAYDGVPFFNAAHGNLVTHPLPIGQLETAARRLANAVDMIRVQRDVNNLGPLGLGMQGVRLVVPTQMGRVAKILCNNPQITLNAGTGSIDNEAYGLARDIIFPYFTDTNNWYLFCDPAEYRSVVVAFFRGIENPVMYAESNANVVTGSWGYGDAINLPPLYLKYYCVLRFGVSWGDWRGSVGGIS